MRDTTSPLPSAALLRDLWNQIQNQWSFLQVPARAQRLRVQLQHLWSQLTANDRLRIIASAATACVLLLSVKVCTRSSTEHPVELVIEYTVNGKVEKRTSITPTFCAIARDTGRLEIGWKRGPQIQFNEVWLGYDVGHGDKERQMFGYYHNDTRYVTSTKPENGEYFLSVSLKDFPAAKHEEVRAVSLKFNLTQHADNLTKNIQAGVEEDKRAQMLKDVLSGLPDSAEKKAEGILQTAALINPAKVIESMFGSADQEALPNALNAATWFFATYPVDAIRDGKKAAEYSGYLLQRPEWLNAVRLDTLAAAYAECGDFDKAVKYQTQAAEKSTEDVRAEYTSRLRLYQKKKPCREW